VKKLTLSAPNRYPAIEENTTLTDKRILVISVKFLINERELGYVCVVDKLISLGMQVYAPALEVAKIQ
jgi:hypothetical protein